VSIVIMHFFGTTENVEWMSLVPTVYYSSLCVSLVVLFIKQIRYNLYSYKAIFYIGFALFIFSVSISHILLSINLFLDPSFMEKYTYKEVLLALLDAPKNYIFLSFPFILVFSIGMTVSNIFLIKYEKKQFKNTLGIILSLALLGGTLVMYILDYHFYINGFSNMVSEMISSFFSAVYLYFECILLGTIIVDALSATFEPPFDKDFIIILGCALESDGSPTPLLKARVDRAVEFYRAQKEKNDKPLFFVTSGGQGSDETIPESTSMKNYLISCGIPEEEIIEEDASTNTYENMRFSKEKIKEINPEAKIAFSTNNYHVFRSGFYAKHVDMRADGIGAPAAWYYWPNASVREFVGLLVQRKKKQIFLLLSMIVTFILLTIQLYR